ncbi:MAG TPA: prepilin-type N-terminal cleavage/methylation domain-containing protein [Acidimicrobiia bacterium]
MSVRTRAGGGAGRGARPDERGLTMIELVVAVSVFAILAGGLALTIEGGLNLARNNRNRSVAANLASQEMDDIRQASFTTLPLGLVDRPQSVDGVPYTVRRESEWVDNDSTKGPCDAGSSTPQVLRVTVSVFWSDMRGVPPVKSSTILSPPVGSYDPNNGHIAVKVLGGTANPLAGVPVTVTASGFNRNLTTTSDGCAFFAFVPPASYTVSLGAVGYVDRQGNLGPAQVTGVTSGAVSSVAFDYDHAATLALTLGSTGGGSFPSGLSVDVGNTALLPTGSKEFTGVGAIRTVGNLFPYPDGYDAWAGSCADADPEGKDGNGLAFWPGATRATGFDSAPGGTATGTVNMPTVELDLDVSWATSGPHTIVASHAADNGCPTGLQYSLGTFSALGPVLVALPYGTWTFQVSGADPAGWPTVALDPRVSGNTIVNLGSL